MDGAYNHVRLIEGGQGDGVNLTPWEVSTTLCFQSENTSVILLDILLLHIRSSEHPVSICLWTCSGSLYSNFTHRVLHLRIEFLLCPLHHPGVWILYSYYLPQEGDQHILFIPNYISYYIRNNPKSMTQVLDHKRTTRWWRKLCVQTFKMKLFGAVKVPKWGEVKKALVSEPSVRIRPLLK